MHRALCCNHSAPQEQPVVASDAPQPEAQASTEVSEVVPAPENAVPAESAPSTENAVVESQPAEPQPSEPASVEPQAEAPKPEAAGKNLPMFQHSTCYLQKLILLACEHSFTTTLHCQILQIGTRTNYQIETSLANDIICRLILLLERAQQAFHAHVCLIVAMAPDLLQCLSA